MVLDMRPNLEIWRINKNDLLYLKTKLQRNIFKVDNIIQCEKITQTSDFASSCELYIESRD